MTGQQLLEALNASDDPDQFVENLVLDDLVRLYEHASGYSACVDEWLDDDYPDKTADLQTKILNLTESRLSETLEEVAAALIQRFSDNRPPITGPVKRGCRIRLERALGHRHKEIGEPKPGDPDFIEPEPATKVPTLREALERAKAFISYARHKLDPGRAVFGDQFVNQEDADDEMAHIDSALARSKSIDDGGPMFPSHGSMGEVAHEGASRRDWLAGRAPPLPGALRALAYQFADVESPDKSHGDKSRAVLMVVAEWRYLYADAMIEAGKKGGAS